MSEHAFDTLRFAERLEQTGMTREQASELSKSLGDFMQEKLVTKQDLKEDLKELEYKLTIRLGGMIIVSFMATVTTLGFLMGWMLKGVH